MNSHNQQAGISSYLVVLVGLVIAVAVFLVVRNGNPTDNPENEPAPSNQNQSESMAPAEAPLAAQNNSRQSGIVTLTEVDGRTQVVIEIASGPAGVQQPAFIHTGTCEQIGSLKYNLNSVVAGKSETTLQPALHFIHGLGQLTVNVRKSATDQTVISCGSITAALDEVMDVVPGEVSGDLQTEGKVSIDNSSRSGMYKEYSESVREAEQAQGRRVVLFFHAPWCPFCKAADSDFKQRVNDFPDDVTVLKVDYDSSAALKTKYGVTYQHTFVQIDANENQVTKWVSGDTKELLANLK